MSSDPPTSNNNNSNSNSNNSTHHGIPTLVPAIGGSGSGGSGSGSGSGDDGWKDYQTTHAESLADPDKFWLRQAKDYLSWDKIPTVGLGGGFAHGDVTWFADGSLNVCYNAVDRHVQRSDQKADQTAIIFEGDEPTDVRHITYRQLQRNVCQIANALTAMGVRPNDVVTIYMPMIPELPMTLLACARIGAVHSVVFAGFSADALSQRVDAGQSQVIVTADIGKRGGKTIPIKEIVNAAIAKLPNPALVRRVLVWERFFPKDQADDHSNDPTDPFAGASSYEMKTGIDVRMNILVNAQRPYSVPVSRHAEDGLFLLYTSGSTGKPKGLLHTTAGYALYAAFTMRHSFGLQPDTDRFACVADCGWITGHTYVVYGPLLNGGTTFVFESTPVYPDANRYWDMVQRHGITQFYTAPTAIRLLMRYGDNLPVGSTDSLKVLGTVGEPINPEAWRWYYQVVGKERCSVVDTYWQTETGGHVITNLPGITAMKPGSCTLPMYGIDPVILDPHTGVEVTEPTDEKGNRQGVLALRTPWPGLARTCLGDHGRYMATYFKPYPGYYFTGDSALQDQDGYTWVLGRVDDVLNVSGHRIGTAEVESALVAHHMVAQAAVVGQPHDIKGQSIAAFCMLMEGAVETPELVHELKCAVRNDIGGFATPDLIVISPSLPMTRSGKIMRRILRKIVCHETDSLGDISTLADPSIVEVLIAKIAALQAPLQT